MGVEAYDEKWDRSIEILAKRVASFKDEERKARIGSKEWVKKVSAKKRTKFMEALP